MRRTVGSHDGKVTQKYDMILWIVAPWFIIFTKPMTVKLARRETSVWNLRSTYRVSVRNLGREKGGGGPLRYLDVDGRTAIHWAYTGWSKSLCAPDDYSTKKKHAKIQYFKHFQSPNMDLLYWTRSARIQFGVSINVWRLAGCTLNITCNFLYCNHQVHRDFLITL